MKEIYHFISLYSKPKGSVLMLAMVTVSGISAEENFPA